MGKFLHILVVCPADNRVMEEVVLRDRIGAVITAAGIHKGGVNPLQLLQFPVREAAAGQLRRQSLQLRQRPVAFFNIRRVNIRHHRSPARHHIDELLSLQDLNGLPHRGPADIESLRKLGINDLFSRLQHTRDDPAAYHLINAALCGNSPQVFHVFRYRHKLSPSQICCSFYSTIIYHKPFGFAIISAGRRIPHRRFKKIFRFSHFLFDILFSYAMIGIGKPIRDVEMTGFQTLIWRSAIWILKRSKRRPKAIRPT